MRNLILAAIALIVASVATPASALEKNTEGWSRLQLSFVAGNVKVKPEGIKADGLNGLALGFSKGISLSKELPIFIEPTAELVWLHQKEETDKGIAVYTDKTNALSLNIPVVGAYKLQFNDNISLVPFFGPNFKLHLVDKTKEEVESEWLDESEWSDESEWLEESIDNLESDEDKRFQFGLSFGVGFNFKMLHVAYRCNPDLSSRWKSSETDDKTKTLYNFITVGFNF